MITFQKDQRMADFASLNAGTTHDKVVAVIERSFEARPMPSGVITRAEVGRRVELAKDIFRDLHADCGWSEQRILDHLLAFLVRGLDGEEPIPPWAARKVGDSESAMWGAEAAGRVAVERRLSALSKLRGEPLIISPRRKTL
jgi:hypothetical protein